MSHDMAKIAQFLGTALANKVLLLLRFPEAIRRFFSCCP